MKSLLDHYGYRWMVHRPSEHMFSKQAVCISTAAGGGMRTANKDIKVSLTFWGVARVYTYGKGVASISWKGVSTKKKIAIEQKINKIAGRIKVREGRVSPSLKVKALFYIMRLAHKKGGLNPADNAYWENKGWIKEKKPW